MLIAGVERGSIARRIGFARGDIILAVNDREIDTVADLKTALARDAHSWQITFRRDGEVETVTVR